MTLDAVVQHGLYVAIAQSAEPLPHKRVRAGSLPAGGTKRPSGNRGLCHAPTRPHEAGQANKAARQAGESSSVRDQRVSVLALPGGCLCAGSQPQEAEPAGFRIPLWLQPRL